MSARKADINGWVEIKNNPISKVGVFEYLGRHIDLPDLDPDKIYKVYRSEKELSDPACIDSFKLLPWIDDHVMLGATDEGLTPANEKGVAGVVGEDVKFESPYLKANIKIFSEALAGLIKENKKELSIGYRAIYEHEKGEYNGERYQIVQRKIRGNHLALVNQGRSGPDVAVLDHFKLTLDSAEFNNMFIKKDGENKTEEVKDEELVTAVTLETLAAQIKMLNEKVDRVLKEEDIEKSEESEELEETIEEAVVDKSEVIEDEKEKVMDEEKNKTKVMDAKIKHLENTIKEFKKNTMDSKTVLVEITQRDQLAAELANHIGVFDHADKTLNEVVQYGLKTLNIEAEKGQEKSILSGFLLGKRALPQATISFDNKEKSGCIDKYLSGAK